MPHLTFWLGLPIALFAAQGAQVESRPYPTVTDERLQHPEAGDWLMYRRTYDGSGFSPLRQITASNIGKLSLAWSLNTDLVDAHETTPIVNHGRMFITTPGNNVIALDARTGTQLWRYVKKYPEGLFQLHPTNRGVALYGDRVYMATTDCELVALDAATGKEAWTVPIDDYKTGCYATLAPLAARGKILVGYSGGEFGVRGSVSAFDAETGRRVWRTYTVPAPDEPGGTTWSGDTYKRGGGSIWITGVFDPASNITYWGTGNPAPWVADNRPGDNLYTDSTLALDIDTGQLKGYHQYTPHDSWDWDEVSAPLLIDTEIDGKLVKTATHAGRNGYLWILDRDRGQLAFLHAFPFANNNVFQSIDPTTGRPTIDESKRPGATQGGAFCPSIGGGKDWVPEAWSPQTKLLYVPANNNICGFLPKGVVPKPDARGFYVGYEAESIFGSVRTSAGAADHLGELQAWDLNTGKRVWQHNFKTILWAPLLVTGGDLVFAGGTPDREFRAFDARTGDQLWSFPAPAGVIGVPTSFEVDGEQYIAVTAGWGLDAQGVQNGIDKIQGITTVVPKAGTVLVFKLRKPERPQSSGLPGGVPIDRRRSQMESPIEVVRRFCAAWSDNIGAAELAAFFTNDAVYHNIPLAPVTGREAIANTIASFIRPGAPGIESIDFRVINIAANGPVVMTERVDVFKLPHKSFELPVMGTFEVRDGKINAWRDYFDMNQFTSRMGSPDQPLSR